MKTYQKLMLTLTIHLLSNHVCDCLTTLREGRRIAEGVPYSLVCTDSGTITQDVTFFKDGAPQGGCIVSLSMCDSPESGYSVTQDISARTTTLHIDSVDATREAGSWTCRQGTDPESAPFVPRSTIPSFLPTSSITVNPSLGSSTTELVDIIVTVPCAHPVPHITWSYTTDGQITLITSTPTTDPTGCPSGQSKLTSIFKAISVQGSGTIVLHLRVEHDSFDPPDYAVVYTSGSIDSGGGTAQSNDSPLPCNDCRSPRITAFLLVVTLVISAVVGS